MALSQQNQRLLLEYAAVFGIPPTAYRNQEEAAFTCLAMLHGLLAIENSSERQRYRDAVLRLTNDLFGTQSEFFARVQGVIALHIVQPAWFSPRASNRELIREFKSLFLGAAILLMLGVSPVGGSIRRGVEESIREGTVRAGLLRAKQRLVQGAGSGIIEALVAKVGTRVPVGAIIVASGIVAFYAMERRMETIRETMTARRNSSLATQNELDEISNANALTILQERLSAYWG